jgi:hypothetical protein
MATTRGSTKLCVLHWVLCRGYEGGFRPIQTLHSLAQAAAMVWVRVSLHGPFVRRHVVIQRQSTARRFTSSYFLVAALERTTWLRVRPVVLPSSQLHGKQRMLQCGRHMVNKVLLPVGVFRSDRWLMGLISDVRMRFSESSFYCGSLNALPPFKWMVELGF